MGYKLRFRIHQARHRPRAICQEISQGPEDHRAHLERPGFPRGQSRQRSLNLPSRTSASRRSPSAPGLILHSPGRLTVTDIVSLHLEGLTTTPLSFSGRDPAISISPHPICSITPIYQRAETIDMGPALRSPRGVLRHGH